MPRIVVTNTSSTTLVISRGVGAVTPGNAVTRDLTAADFTAVQAELVSLETSGNITYTVSNDPTVDDASEFATVQRPSASLSRSTAQAISDATPTAVVFNTVDYSNGIENASLTTLTVPEAGVYLVTAQAGMTAAAGVLEVRILSGATVVAAAANNLVAATLITVGASVVVNLAAGAAIGLTVSQNSGGPVNTDITAGFRPRLTLTRVG